MDMFTAQQRRAEEHEVRYPVHHAIATSVRSGTTIEPIIRRVYDADHESVRRADDNGLTPLHLAAGLPRLAAVRALLALPEESGVKEDLTRRDNADGVTPLEACEHQMRSTREFSESMLGAWAGNSEDGLRVTLLLRRAAGENITETDDEYVRVRRWGCTCNTCAGGWLSPRMKYRLQGTFVSLLFL